MSETTKEYIDRLTEEPQLSLDIPTIMKMLTSFLRENPEEAKELISVLCENLSVELTSYSQPSYNGGSSHTVSLNIEGQTTSTTIY